MTRFREIVNNSLFTTDDRNAYILEHADQMSAALEDISTTITDINTYGLDRTGLRIYNRDKKLSKFLDIYIPSSDEATYDDFDRIGIACQESIAVIIGGIVAFIIAVIGAIVAFISNKKSSGTGGGKATLNSLQEQEQDHLHEIMNLPPEILQKYANVKYHCIDPAEFVERWLKFDKMIKEITNECERRDDQINLSPQEMLDALDPSMADDPKQEEHLNRMINSKTMTDEIIDKMKQFIAKYNNFFDYLEDTSQHKLVNLSTYISMCQKQLEQERKHDDSQEKLIKDTIVPTLNSMANNLNKMQTKIDNLTIQTNTNMKQLKAIRQESQLYLMFTKCMVMLTKATGKIHKVFDNLHKAVLTDIHQKEQNSAHS
jgi:hypothetical protein